MTESAAREFAPDAYAQDFTDYARVFTALGYPPDFDPRVEDADSAGALDVILTDGLGLAALGHLALYVLSVLTDLGIEKAAEHGTERLWRRLPNRGKKHKADATEGDHPAAEAPDANGQPDVPELVTTITARLPQGWAGHDGPALEAVVEVQVKAYLKVARDHAGAPGKQG